MAVSKNEHTGDRMVSGPNSTAYQDGWDLIWGKKKADKPVEPAPEVKPVTGTKAPKVGRK